MSRESTRGSGAMRGEHGTRRRVLSLLVSAVMVMSLVPAPALAEMMDEASRPTANMTTEGESHRQTTDDAMGEKTPSGGEAPASPPPAVQQDSAPSDQEQGAVEMLETESAPDDSAPSSVVTPQNTDPVVVVDGTPVVKPIENHDLGSAGWSAYFEKNVTPYTGYPVTADALQAMQVLVFNAQAGAYINERTDFVLHHFENMNNVVVTPKEKGSYYAVYQGVGDFTGSIRASFTVADQHDLAYASISVHENCAFLADGVATPQVTVKDLVGNTLSEGSDYVLQYFEGYLYSIPDSAQPLDVLNQKGVYSVRAVPVAGSQYLNSSPIATFSVFASTSISESDWAARFSPSGSVECGTTELPTPVVYRTSSEDPDANLRIVEDTDYRFDRIVSTSSGEVSYEKAVPATVGTYNVFYKGINSYSGEISIFLTVNDCGDIGTSYWYAQFSNYRSEFYTDGAPVDLPPLMLTRNYASIPGQLTQDVDFRLDHFEDSEYQPLDGAPAEEGRYYAVYEGMGTHRGQRKVGFTLHNTYDLSNANVRLGQTNLKIIDANDINKLDVSVRDANGLKLQEGVDYTLEYFDFENNSLQGAPYYAGTFYVAAVAKDGDTPYTGMSPKQLFTIGGGESESGSDTIQVGPIVPDQPYSFKDGSAILHKWEGSFTAPKTGCYYFKFGNTSYDKSINVRLFADEACTIALDEHSFFASYTIQRRMDEGQTIYWRLDTLSVRETPVTLTVSMADIYDLSLARVNANVQNAQLQNGCVVPQLSVLDPTDETVDPNNYTFKYQLNGCMYDEITSPGGYVVWAVAKGDTYHGETPRTYLYVTGDKDLAGATMSISDYRFAYTGYPIWTAATVTDGLGRTLTEYQDYQLAYYRTVDNVSERVLGAPIEPGTYYVVAEPSSFSEYTGRTRSVQFTIVDETDISNRWSAILADPPYRMNIGYQSVPVYCMTGSEVRPSVRIQSLADSYGVVDPSEYDVSYSNNTSVSAPGEFATLTITSKRYKGSITRQFKIVDKCDLHDMVATSYVYISNARSTGSATYSNATKQFLTTGWDADPCVRFNGGDSSDAVVQNRDFTVSFATADGVPLPERPKEEGKYRLVLTATETGNATGSAFISFTLVASQDLRDSYSYPSLSSGFTTTEEYWIPSDHPSRGANNSDMIVGNNFFIGLRTNTRKLVENLDYVLTSAFDAVTGFLSLTFTGAGQYEGTVRQNIYVSGTRAQEFANRGASVRDTVYVDANGTLRNRGVYIEGLTENADYTFVGYEDADGNRITTAEVGETVYLVAEGRGLYADPACVRKVQTTVRGAVSDWTPARPIESATVSLEEGIYMHSYASATNGAGNKWYLLRSKATNPVVALVIYGSDGVRMNGNQGYTVSTTLNGSTAQVKVDTQADAPISGSKTLDVALVDSYDLTQFSNYVEIKSPERSSPYYYGSAGPVQLVYSGVAYRPTYAIPYGMTGGFKAQTTDVLKDSSGKVVEKINGTGSYTLEIAGTGDWSGSVTVPIQVTEGPNRIDMGDCTISIVGGTELRNGKAEPAVTVRYGNEVLTAGKDYTLAYGANSQLGSRGYVTATATQGGRFSGSVSTNFTVGETLGKNLRNGSYALRLTDAAGNTYLGANTVKRTFVVSCKEEAPKVEVLASDFLGNESVLSADCYDVEYGPLDKSGLGYVKVTGRPSRGYSGSLSANFNVIAKQKLPSSISLAAQTKTYTGKAQTYSGNVTKSGSTGAVTYAYYSDKACTKAVANVVNVGTYYVVGTLHADNNYKSAVSAPVAFTIVNAPKTFRDVPENAWYYGVVSRAVALGIISGYSDGCFGPEDKITRAQVAVALWRMAGQPAAGAGAKTFPDVRPGAYYYEAVRWASSTSIVSGYGNGLFGSADNVTREQLAVMIASYARNVTGRQPSGSAADYASMFDRGEVSSWAIPSVGWCFRYGILSGSGGRINPRGNATRAEAAKMVVCLHDLLT